VDAILKFSYPRFFMFFRVSYLQGTYVKIYTNIFFRNFVVVLCIVLGQGDELLYQNRLPQIFFEALCN
jgi:hypothetical protein